MKNKKALLVTDMIDVYVYDKPLIPIESRDVFIKNIKKSINLARQKKIPVIYANSAFRDSDPIFKLINYRRQSQEYPKESPIISELQPKKGDYIIKKRGFDSFWQSNLEKLLKKLNINEIFLTGCQTDCCIRETAVTASHLGYDVYIIEDCCETNREFGQVAAIRFLKMCTKGVIKVEQLNKFFSS